MRRSRTSYSEKPASKYLKSIIWGTFSGSFICALLLFAVTFLFVKLGYMPEDAMNIVTILIACIGIFFGGYIAAKISREKGLFIGMAVGAMIFSLVTLASVLVINEPITALIFTKSAIMIITGAIGGLVGVSNI